jgi:hypothetical protein
VLGHGSSLAVCCQASMIQSGRRRMHQWLHAAQEYPQNVVPAAYYVQLGYLAPSQYFE